MKLRRSSAGRDEGSEAARRLLMPALVWEQATTALRRRPHDRERVVFFDGHRGEGTTDVITTLTLPEAETHRGHYEISAEQMSRAGKHLRRFGLLRLAQLHCHPGEWTGHSPEDDDAAFSQRDGAISIIAPDYAGCAPGLADCGVHQREPGGWRRLGPSELAERIVIVPSTVDLRP